MATIINADTSDGLKFTSDTSGEIKLQSGGADIATVDSSGIAAASGKVFSGDGSSLTGVGKILQVVSTTKTDTLSTTSTSFIDVTGLSVSITPSSTSSKILVLGTLQWNTTGHATARLLRDATNIAVGDSAGSRIQGVFHISTTNNYGIDAEHIAWLDSPATTSAVTYKFQVAVPYSSSYVVTVNRSYQDTDIGYQTRVPSSIVVMEVAG